MWNRIWIAFFIAAVTVAIGIACDDSSSNGESENCRAGEIQCASPPYEIEVCINDEWEGMTCSKGCSSFKTLISTAELDCCSCGEPSGDVCTAANAGEAQCIEGYEAVKVCDATQGWMSVDCADLCKTEAGYAMIVDQSLDCCLCSDPSDGDDDDVDEAEKEEEMIEDLPTTCEYDPELVGHIDRVYDSNATEETVFMQAQSNPIGKAVRVTSNNIAIGEYAKLDITPDDYATATEPLELVFKIDVDFTYYYILAFEYVGSLNFGEVQVYIDDYQQPLSHKDSSQPKDDTISLHRNLFGTNDAEIVGPIEYEMICLEEGEHLLHLRVSGKTATSQGYAIGLDYIKMFKGSDPDNPEE